MGATDLWEEKHNSTTSHQNRVETRGMKQVNILWVWHKVNEKHICINILHFKTVPLSNVMYCLATNRVLWTNICQVKWENAWAWLDQRFHNHLVHTRTSSKSFELRTFLVNALAMSLVKGTHTKWCNTYTGFPTQQLNPREFPLHDQICYLSQMLRTLRGQKYVDTAGPSPGFTIILPELIQCF